MVAIKREQSDSEIKKKSKKEKRISSLSPEERRAIQKKIADITNAIKENNILKLRELAVRKKGLLTSKLRKKAWPLLLGFTEIELEKSQRKCEDVFNNKDRDQILLDIRRAYGCYPVGISEDKRTELQDALDKTVNEIFTLNPKLSYYQGYHDVCAVFQQVLGPSKAVRCLERLSNTTIKDFLASDLSLVLSMLKLLFPLLHKVDFDLYCFLARCGIDEAPTVAVSWLLTWFAHEIQDITHVSRLYDFFLAFPHPLLTIYAITAVLVSCRDDIFKCECEFSEVFQIIKKCPETVCIDEIVNGSLCYLRFYNPEKLMADALFNATDCPSVFEFPFTWIPAVETMNDVIVIEGKPECYFPIQKSEWTKRRMVRFLSQKNVLIGLFSLVATGIGWYYWSDYIIENYL